MAGKGKTRQNKTKPLRHSIIRKTTKKKERLPFLSAIMGLEGIRREEQGMGFLEGSSKVSSAVSLPKGFNTNLIEKERRHILLFIHIFFSRSITSMLNLEREDSFTLQTNQSEGRMVDLTIKSLQRIKRGRVLELIQGQDVRHDGLKTGVMGLNETSFVIFVEETSHFCRTSLEEVRSDHITGERDLQSLILDDFKAWITSQFYNQIWREDRE